MDEARMAKAFNEWMRRYTEEPEKFTREFQMVMNFLSQEAAGETPTYGTSAAKYFSGLLAEIPA